MTRTNGSRPKGWVENSETARREFVNQVGRYNKRLQGPMRRWARDIGFGPFATAGTTFNVLGTRGITLNPGVRARTPAAAVAIKANMLAKLAGSAATVGLLNYIFTHKQKGGGVMGRPGTKLGEIDLGTDDKNGRHNVLRLFSMLGPGRGYRVTGARGFVEAKRLGLSTANAADAAAKDLINGAFSPFAGPPVRFASVAATGQSPAIGVPRAAEVVPPGHSQMAARSQGRSAHGQPTFGRRLEGHSARFDRVWLRTVEIATAAVRGRAGHERGQGGKLPQNCRACASLPVY